MAVAVVVITVAVVVVMRGLEKINLCVCLSCLNLEAGARVAHLDVLAVTQLGHPPAFNAIARPCRPSPKLIDDASKACDLVVICPSICKDR